MKKTPVFTALLLILLTSAQAQKDFRISAALQGLPDSTLIILKNLYEPAEEDYAVVLKNRFSIVRSIKEGSLYQLSAGSSNSEDNLLWIYIHPGSEITITGETAIFKEAKITGSQEVVEWLRFYTSFEKDTVLGNWHKFMVETIIAHQGAYGDTAALNKLKPAKEKVLGMAQKILNDWFNAHPTSTVNGYVVEQLIYNLLLFQMGTTTEQVETYLNKLTPEARNNMIVKKMIRDLPKLKKSMNKS